MVSVMVEARCQWLLCAKSGHYRFSTLLISGAGCYVPALVIISLPLRY